MRGARTVIAPLPSACPVPPPPPSLKQLLLECGAVLKGEFTLTSGEKSSYYVDIKKAATKPAVLKEIAARFAPLARDADLVAGMELGAVPLATAVSLASGKPFLIIRKGERKHGTGKRIEGDFRAGERVLLVEDVATTGGSMVEAVKVLRDAGLVMARAACVVDRGQGGAAKLAAEGVTLEALVSAKELLE